VEPAVDELFAVVGHSLLNSMSVIKGLTEILHDPSTDLDEARRDEILARIIAQAAHASGVLTHLVRGDHASAGLDAAPA
jgi:signal transduction histidine kinase